MISSERSDSQTTELRTYAGKIIDSNLPIPIWRISLHPPVWEILHRYIPTIVILFPDEGYPGSKVLNTDNLNHLSVPTVIWGGAGA